MQLGTSATLLAFAFAVAVSACGLSDEGAATDSGPITTQTATQTPESPGQGTPIEPNGVVVFVVDGDTVQVDFGGVDESIRFIGIDTPEKTGGFRDAECFGDEASARMKELLGPGDGVYIELDEEARDRFDRLLGYVFRASDGLFLNMVMVDEGLAAAFPFPPNTLYADLFDEAEATARRLDLGLWRACGSADVLLPGGGD